MPTEKGHILVVDDHKTNRIKISLAVKALGHTVEVAEHGRQALEMLQTQSFDLVLLDIIMPELDGYQVLQQMKADRTLSNIPVIVISAEQELESVVRGIELGAEDYLPKTFDPVLLKARMGACLEKKRLRAELVQSEKLATLGRLSAGVAHEINNPAAATQRGAGQLRQVFFELQTTHLQLDRCSLSEGQLEHLLRLGQLAKERAEQPDDLNPLERSDREYELETWLEDQGLDNAWELAPTLVSLGHAPDKLVRIAEIFSADLLPTVIVWISSTYTIHRLLAEIDHGAFRISEIVKALKGYTYMDQAPIQIIDIHEGLNNTLIILQSKLKDVAVRREYAADLPRIQAYGSELNQVWTNIIDNAIAAMKGHGELILRTHSDSQWVVIEIEDNGPGIPEANISKLFDPFFTTKPPGEGTGLGLNISHNIVVQKHKGKIVVTSQPGSTCFEIKLPLNLEVPETQ